MRGKKIKESLSTIEYFFDHSPNLLFITAYQPGYAFHLTVFVYNLGLALSAPFPKGFFITAAESKHFKKINFNHKNHYIFASNLFKNIIFKIFFSCLPRTNLPSKNSQN
ncbi:MAG: hypothetical protein A2381_09595 [Bdellovibrionales bacterium RIFOXYB1_FULL_37_110]|nr:MAG: hypothetical protein A2417_02900 [Bdellovibrionales bacterium RIFOXYC1_FULL_37_79]OFZ59516.1 MAG: hypothetical protein A2381_09595 [Bdellovibrionales bacterium RIFOXYB1_FULL_37_110]OFZ64235.1 MAG: hypothetical protein A2577_12445 [Bdellovibrionales bacterium RIFOXYD1_FULL_36_51]